MRIGRARRFFLPLVAATSRALLLPSLRFGLPALALRGGGLLGRRAVSMSTVVETPNGPQPTPLPDAPIPLSSLAVSASGAEPSTWQGDLLVLAFWEVEKGSSVAMGSEATAVDAATGGIFFRMHRAAWIPLCPYPLARGRALSPPPCLLPLTPASLLQVAPWPT